MNNMLKGKIFYIFTFLVALVLIIISQSSRDRSQAIIAQVESQKTAVSFHKPVRVKNIEVISGQEIKKGQVLLEVERPDLILDKEKNFNEKQRLLSDRRKLELDYKSTLNLLMIETDQKVVRLEADMVQLKNEMEMNESLYSQISGLVDIDSSVVDNRWPELIKLNSLKEEIRLLKNHLKSERERLKILLEEDLRTVDLRLVLIDQEINELEKEEQSLVQKAPFDGTIGNVNAQLMELIPPFKTIISIYESHPTIIKAYMNDKIHYTIKVGDKVTVESFNRTYQINGEVFEIGARIVPYPKQINSPTQVALWGQEIFVKIPEQNNFLNGEKVFVIIKPNQ